MPDLSPKAILNWPVLRQLAGPDKLGRGDAVTSPTTRGLVPRTAGADRTVKSICPFCAVGCGQNVYVKDEKVVHIEGDPDSPISRGRLCPKGSASLQLTTGDAREQKVLYRRPYGTDWESLDLDTAMQMVADRVLQTRADTFEWESKGQPTRRTLGIASLGGATLDNEENYLIKKMFSALGIVQVENQARVCHSSTVAGLGTSFGRGGGTTYLQDLQNSDCIIIEGSNFAEAHPVGFQWVMEAKARGATVIHIDPRYSRTSALSDIYVPIRAGTDIVWLGALINQVLTQEKYFPEYVVNYTNAAVLIKEEFRDTEDLDGVFSGLDEEGRKYDTRSWMYEGVEVSAASGERDQEYADRTAGGGTRRGRRNRSHTASAGRRCAVNRRGTRRCSTRGACSRSSSGTTPATPPRWSRRSAAYRRRPSTRCSSCSSATPTATTPPRSATPSAGPSTPSGCSTSARRASCSCCSATSGVPAAASWPCAATRASRGPATSRPCSTCCRATCRCRTPTMARPCGTTWRPTRPPRASGRTCPPT